MEIQMELSSVIKQSFSFSYSHYDCVIIDFNCISVHLVIYFVCFKGTVCETQWTGHRLRHFQVSLKPLH